MFGVFEHGVSELVELVERSVFEVVELVERGVSELVGEVAILCTLWVWMTEGTLERGEPIAAKVRRVVATESWCTSSRGYVYFAWFFV